MSSVEETEDVEIEGDGGADEGTDPLKIYVLLMGALALVLGFFLYRTTIDRAAFEKANADAETVFGGPTTAPGQDDRPTTIRSLAIGVQKYLQTTKDAKNKIGDSASSIPVQKIREQAAAMDLTIKGIEMERITPNASKGYEEVSVTVQFEGTDLDHFAKFLYNLETSSTKIRVLEVKWDLMNEKENPVQPGQQPGNRILGPTAKVGFRRPAARK